MEAAGEEEDTAEVAEAAVEELTNSFNKIMGDVVMIAEVDVVTEVVFLLDVE